MEENKIPSAEELASKILNKHQDTINYDEGDLTSLESNIKAVLIEFAKLHVEAALKAASEKVVVKYSLDEQAIKDYALKETLQRVLFGTSFMLPTADKDSILNAYSLDEIK